MAVTGEFAESARTEMPLTWSALQTDTLSRYGDSFLQRKIDQVKWRILGIIVDPGDEDQYDPIVIEYIGKLIAINICPAAADFWASQQVTKTTDNMTTEFPDRVKAIWDLQEKLIGEALAMKADVEAILGPLSRTTTAKPKIGVADGNSDASVTQDPFTFPRTFELPGADAVIG